MIRVMIVASYVEVREGLCMLLQLSGDIQVTGAVADLKSAIREAGTAIPDVVLVDLEMPGGEGYETIRKLKRLYPSTKTVALTSHDYPEARERATQAGASFVMVKGLGITEMLAAFQMVAREKKLKQI